MRRVGVARSKSINNLRISCLAAMGNGNGIFGVGFGKAKDRRTAIKAAVNSASKRLIKIDLCENRTVYHNFRAESNKTRMLVFRKPENYGLTCHRVLSRVCKMIGIKDLRVKVENNAKNTHCLVLGFLDGLLKMVICIPIKKLLQITLNLYSV